MSDDIRVPRTTIEEWIRRADSFGMVDLPYDMRALLAAPHAAPDCGYCGGSGEAMITRGGGDNPETELGNCTWCGGTGSPPAAQPTGELDKETFVHEVMAAMQAVWDDHCADTGCYPHDIQKGSKRGELEFHAGQWARGTAEWTYARLRKPLDTQTAQPDRAQEAFFGASTVGERDNRPAWHELDTPPNCPTITDDEPVKLIWHDKEGRKCTKWCSANQIGELFHPPQPVTPVEGKE